MTQINAQDLRKLSESLTSIGRDLEQAVEPLRQMTVSFSKALAPHQQQAKAIQEALGLIGKQAISALEPLRQWGIRNHRLLEEIRKAVQEWPARQREAVVKLAHYGWYIDPEMPITASMELARALDAGIIEEVREFVTEYVRKNLQRIEQRIAEHCPHRKHILTDAFDAHRNGKYNLSIPVLLAQADGIWCDEFSASLFRGKERTHTVRSQLQENQDTLIWGFFSIFEEKIPLWMSESQRDSSFDHLNRHLVLHGEAVDYGTEENGLKAISFLSWLCWTLDWKNKKAA